MDTVADSIISTIMNIIINKCEEFNKEYDVTEYMRDLLYEDYNAGQEIIHQLKKHKIAIKFRDSVDENMYFTSLKIYKSHEDGVLEETDVFNRKKEEVLILAVKYSSED